MPIPERFREALFQEFVGFYHVSEAPDSWDEWLEEKLERAASSGAARMRYRIASNDISEFVAYLRSESQNRQGSLVQEIEHWTQSLWAYNDKKWNVLQQLLNAIADQLEAREKQAK